MEKLFKSFRNFYLFLLNFVLRHFLILFFSTVFLSFIFVLNTMLFQVIPVNESVYFAPFKYIFYPQKKIEMFAYLITIPFLFLLFISFTYLILNIKKVNKFFRPIRSKTKVYYLLFLFVIDTILSIRIGRGATYGVTVFLLWFIFNVYIPVKCVFSKHFCKIKLFEFKNLQNNGFVKFFVFVTAVFYIFNLVFIFYPHVFNKLYLIKEIQNIPLVVKYFDKQNNVELIDEIDFLENEHIYGYRKLYDIRKPEKSLDGVNCVKVSNPENLKKSLNDIIDSGHIYVNYSSFSKKFFEYGGFKNLIFNYFYQEGDKICSINKLSQHDIELLKKDLPLVEKNDFLKVEKNNYYIPDVHDDRKNLSNAEKLKQKKVMDYLTWNGDFYIEGRWWHHHNHILSSMVSLSNNERPDKVFMQYGYGTTLLLNKILSLKNGFNIGDYSNIINFFYYLYYIPFFILMIFLFKNPVIFVSLWGIILCSLNKFIYAHYYIAPGANPIRHFADIFVLGALYCYLKNNNKLLFWFIHLICLLGIFLYPTYGLFLSLAFITAIFIKQIERKSKFEIYSCIFFILSTLVAYKCFSIGLKLEMSAYWDGISVFLATQKVLCFIYTLFILSYILIAFNIKKHNLYKDLFVFLILYCQGIALYYITISEITHFLVMAPIYAVTLFIFLKLLFDTFDIDKQKIKNIYTVIFLVVLVATPLSFANNVYDKYTFLKKGKYFENYTWNIDGSNFSSSMNPVYLEDSINLLKNPKYGSKNKVYLISEADNLLLPLAQVSNSFGYIDLQWYLCTPKIYNKLATLLLKNKPQYIFVDNFITSGKLETMITLNVISDNREFYWASLRKYQRLKNLEALFNLVKDDYKPLIKTKYLTLYERK